MATEETLQEQPSALGQKSRFPEAEESFCEGSHDAPPLDVESSGEEQESEVVSGKSVGLDSDHRSVCP